MLRKQKGTKNTDIDSNEISTSELENHQRNERTCRGKFSKKTIEILLTLILVVLMSFRVDFSANEKTNSEPTTGAHYKLLEEKDSPDQSATIESSEQIVNKQEERDFLSLGLKYGTDKVAGNAHLKACLEDGECARKECKRVKCRPWGHFYNTFYQRQLGHLSKNATDNQKEFQFLEVGFFNGIGFDTYTDFFPSGEMHSMEISCMGFDSSWHNFAAMHRNYDSLVEQQRLHCGDASNVTWLHNIWTTKMNRTDGTAPPLKVVVDDGSHLADHMAQTVFFWFPRIQPGGFLIVEDIQPTQEANTFRTQFLPQIMSDLHYCGDPTFVDNGPCYPTLMPLLASVYCEMHICMFERNDEPAIDLDLVNSTMPHTALDASQCKSLERK